MLIFTLKTYYFLNQFLLSSHMGEIIDPKDVGEFLMEAATALGREKGFELVSLLPSHSKGVFKVEDDEGYKVLKLLDTRVRKVLIEGEEIDFNTFLSIKALYFESLVLDIVDAERLPNFSWYEGPSLYRRGIGRALDKIYPRRIALLREYVEGNPLGEWNRTGYTASGRVLSNDFSLADAVLKIHDAGFSGLDLIPPNIVINSQGDSYFIDLFDRSMRNHWFSMSGKSKFRDYTKLAGLYEDNGNELIRYIEATPHLK